MVEPQEQVFEIAVVGRVIWNLHSLNNEGTIGNVTEPRTVVLWNGTKTDGVSGEMLKHIHAFWTWLQAKQNNLPLCGGCQTFQPQRADIDAGGLGRGDNVTAMIVALKRCVLCDLHGFLVQAPTIHRQSVVEFGWTVGLPGQVYRDVHVHARHAPAERGVDRERRPADEERTEVAAQMLYHRPTRSGAYGLVTLFQPWRIGLDEVSYSYAIGEDERAKRYQLALTAYEWTFKRPDGAMTTTRYPHIEGLEGVILVSRKPVPVPLLSPLKDDYREKLEELGRIQDVETYRFQDVVSLTIILSELKKALPFHMFQ